MHCRLLFVFLTAIAAAGVQNLTTLPNGAVANAVQVDSSGNIYIAGYYPVNSQDPNAPVHAFAAELSPDGSQILWWTNLAGSNDDNALAIALGPGNALFVTGTTYSADFPTTPGAMQTAKAQGVDNQGFVVKLDTKGAVVYSTYIGGGADSAGHGIFVDAAGHAFITGCPNTAQAAGNGFIVELDPAGATAPVSIAGFGGSAITVDSQGFIYAAGSIYPRTSP